MFIVARPRKPRTHRLFPLRGSCFIILVKKGKSYLLVSHDTLKSNLKKCFLHAVLNFKILISVFILVGREFQMDFEIFLKRLGR